MNGANSGDASERALIKAYRLLTYGDRSKRGLYDKLREAGFDEEAANAAVEQMEAQGYIDDAKYAANFITYAAENKGHGRRRILQDLRQKGVDRELAENALEEYYGGLSDMDGDAATGDPELDTAVGLIKRRIGQQGFDPDELDFDDKRRLFGYLARRGFGPGTIKAALERISEGE